MNTKTLIAIWAIAGWLAFFNCYLENRPQPEILSPIVPQTEEIKIEVPKVEENTPEQEETNFVKPRKWSGTASYYSREGCVGCRDDLLMANGEPLDDSKLTVAFNWLTLNTSVRITNLANGKEVVAKVTDTGGFNELGRIVDLGLATKEYLSCTDLCEVSVEEL